VSRREAYAVVGLVAALPRLAALLVERGEITAENVDKGDVFARTFVQSGTYGFIPGIPSAYTQPLYGYFLIPLHWLFERSWVVVGGAQILLAVATAFLVFELGSRLVTRPVGLVAALLTTLHPYLIWHDVHMNREILDHFLAVAAVFLTIVLAERGGARWAALLGLVCGLMILGNVRTLFVPLVLGAFVLWRRRTWEPVVVALLAAVVVVPWVVRNELSVGCLAITTDSRALWKANNENTLETLRAGGWIDDVPDLPGAPPSPQDAGELWEETGRIVRVDECKQMRFYRTEALEFMVEEPVEKAKLAGYGARFLWQPSVPRTEGRPGRGTILDTGRDVVEPLFMVPFFALGLLGLWTMPRRYVVLAVTLLAYQTLIAMLFIGQTRYRVPWDFLLAVPAAVALSTFVARARRRAG
jgi:4-amino-4-deoxy-L-arabinose transferase-like glycosyltransferase